MASSNSKSSTPFLAMFGGTAAAPMEVSRCVDQSDVREGLRKVSQLAPCGRVVLFRQQPDIIAERQQPLEDFFCLFVLSLKGENVGQPEGAKQKDSLAVRQTIDSRIRDVPSDEASCFELLANHVDGPDHAR